MATVTMKQLKLFALREQQEQLLQDLMRLGYVEISEQNFVRTDPEVDALLWQEPSDTVAQKAEHKLLQTALDILEAYAPEKRRLLFLKPEMKQETFPDQSDLDAIRTLADRIVKRDEIIRHQIAEISRLNGQIISLQAWKNLELPLDSDGTEQCCVVFGTVPLSMEITELRVRLESVTEEAELFHVDTGRELHYLVFVCFREVRHDCIKALREYGFSVVIFPGVTGTAMEAIREMEQTQRQLQNEVDTFTSEMISLAVHREALKCCYKQLEMQVAVAEIRKRLYGTEQTIYLVGRVPESKVESLEELLSRYKCAWELTEPDPRIRKRYQSRCRTVRLFNR